MAPPVGHGDECLVEPAVFRRFCDLVYEHAGIRLHEGKQALLKARLGKRLRALGIDSMRRYLRYVEGDASGHELAHLLDCVSTNYTSFFRERRHFELLAQVVRRVVAGGRRKLRLWCAASSTGEEPYSIAMTLAEALKGEAVDYKILATDISTRALDTARAGVYRATALAPLTRMERRHFVRRPGGKEEQWEVRPHLRAHLVFRWLNLATGPFPMRGPLDVIFCRNVMIYFDAPVRQQLIAEVQRLLRPGGILFIGHAETLTGVRGGLGMVEPSVYTAG